MASPQTENGFVPLANELIEAFFKCKMLEYERVIVLCVWRKTYGWGKKDDWISNSQFFHDTGIARPNITRTLNSLFEKKILVKVGKKIAVNKNWEEWKIEWRVPMSTPLSTPVKVISPDNTQKVESVISPDNKVISPDNKMLSHQIPTITKIQTTKTNRRAKPAKEFNPLGAEILKAFEEVDPKNKRYYGNTTQRGACDFLLAEYGLEEVLKRITVLPRTNKIPYFPTITSPHELQEKWVKLQDAVDKKRLEAGAKAPKVAFT